MTVTLPVWSLILLFNILTYFWIGYHCSRPFRRYDIIANMFFGLSWIIVTLASWVVYYIIKG